MSDLNLAVVSGRLGHSPKLTYTQNGTAKCALSLATTKYQKNEETGTVWHKIVIWGKQAEAADKYLSKGSYCTIQGEIDNRSYEGRDGTKKYISEIIAFKVVFGPRNSEGGDNKERPRNSKDDNQSKQRPQNSGYKKQPQNKIEEHSGPSDDDIPF